LEEKLRVEGSLSASEQEEWALLKIHAPVLLEADRNAAIKNAIVMGGVATKQLVWDEIAKVGEAGAAAAVGAVASNKNGNIPSRTTSEADTSSSPKKGSLKGEPEIPPKNANPDMVRSIARQNQAAQELANLGYDVEQLANTGRKGANPDLRINGELADVYSPMTTSSISVLKTVEAKVKNQAQNIVINLADSSLSIKKMADVSAQNPVAGLNKVYLMKDGGIKIIEAAK